MCRSLEMGEIAWAWAWTRTKRTNTTSLLPCRVASWWIVLEKAHAHSIAKKKIGSDGSLQMRGCSHPRSRSIVYLRLPKHGMQDLQSSFLNHRPVRYDLKAPEPDECQGVCTGCVARTSCIHHDSLDSGSAFPCVRTSVLNPHISVSVVVSTWKRAEAMPTKAATDKSLENMSCIFGEKKR